MYEATDLKCSLDNDLSLSPINDLQDTIDDPYASLRQEVNTRAQAGNNSFALHPDLGANLYALVGQPNNQETGASATSALEKTLTDGLIQSENLNVEVFPLDATTLGAFVTVATQGNLPEAALPIPVIFNLGANILTVS
jgi:hypothetical protein